MKRLSILIICVTLLTSGCSSSQSSAINSDNIVEDDTFSSSTTVESMLSDAPEEASAFSTTVESMLSDALEEASASSTTVESMLSDTLEEETSTSTATDESTTALENEVIGTELFETVYFPYANRDNSFSFNSVKTHVESTDYDIEITEPTSKEVGMIMVSEENGDNVFFSFIPKFGVETIMTVSYFCSNKQTEVSLSNYSNSGSPKYDYFEIHVLGQNANEVENVNEQRIFLFQN